MYRSIVSCLTNMFLLALMAGSVSGSALAQSVPKKDIPERFHKLPEGWSIVKSFIIPGKPDTQVDRISNTTFAVGGRHIQVNLVECKTEMEAARVHELIMIAQGKVREKCPKDSKTAVEIICDDRKLIERAYTELGLKAPRVDYIVTFRAAPIDKCDYTVWNAMFNACLPAKPNEALIRNLARNFTFGEQIRVRNRGLGGAVNSFTFSPQPRDSRVEAGGDFTVHSFADLPRRYGLPDVGVTVTVTSEAFAITPTKRKAGPELLGANEFWPCTDPEIVALARKITTGKASDRDKVAALLEWFSKKENIDYGGPVGSRHGVKKVFQQKVGRCWDYSDCFVTLCRAVGVPSRQVLGWLDGVGGGGHIWAEVLIAGEGWRQVDPQAGMGCDTRYVPYIACEDGRAPLVYISGVDIKVKR